MGYKISVDVGGTFTDLTISDEDKLLGRHKSPTTPEDLTQGVLNCIGLAGDRLNISTAELLSQTDVFIHGSTIATNAILEKKGVKCGVICTKGTKYTLWRGEGRRKDLFNYKVSANQELVRPYLCLEVSERINKDGRILLPLNEDDVRSSVRQFKKWNVEAISVCLLWSIINPIHEQRIGEIINDEWPEIPFSLSFDIQPIIREYHRMSCVTLNAMIKPIVTDYLEKLQEALANKGFKGDPLIVISSGGVVPIEEVKKKPVFMLFSGPSMAPVSGRYYAQKNNEKNCIIIDMGGTSFDVGTVIGELITTTREGRINQYPTGVASNEILTLGAGGGSIAWVDSSGILSVGPKSSGAIPGPACYMRGGREATVTDACVTLGYIVPDYFLGGRMALSPVLARKAIEKIAKPLNMSVEKAALGICQIAREKMVGGILNMTVRRGIDPREFVIVSGGGATGLFAASLADEIKVRRVIIPKETAVLCAFGGLNADISMSNVASKYSISNEFDYEKINQTLEELDKKGKAFINRLGLSSTVCEFEFYVSARYPMQVTELEIPLENKELSPQSLSKLIQDFHAMHHARYKTSDSGSQVEFVMWRSVAKCLTPGITLQEKTFCTSDPSDAMIGKQQAIFDDSMEFAEIPYYDGEKLYNGMKVEGPAIVVLPDTTVIVPKQHKLLTQLHGYFIIERNI
ncbi:MAG: hydantoinase/oxoprolinase family protein [Desulfobacterales bacterium]|nr:hydantoinase/oxoprolinase family protein [Desulfobacterales bacterium]